MLGFAYTVDTGSVATASTIRREALVAQGQVTKLERALEEARAQAREQARALEEARAQAASERSRMIDFMIEKGVFTTREEAEGIIGAKST